MALVVNDRVKETSTTTGTGTLNLAGAVAGFETFVAGIGNSNTTYYSIVNENGEFEVGLGTVTDATPDTLARTTVISSSNSDSAVNFSAGTKDVFCTLPASKAVILDSSGNIVANNGSNLTALNATALASGTVANARLDAQLQDVAGLAVTDGNIIVGDGSNFVAENGATARTSLGLGTAAVLDTGISNTNVPKFTSGVADNDFLRVDGTAIEGRSSSEVLSDIGGQASLTFGISNTNAVKIDSASVADDEYARFTANGLESRSTAEVLSDTGAITASSTDTLTNKTINASQLSGTVANARLDAQLQDVAGLATTSGKIIQGDGSNFTLSAYTLPTADGSAGKVLTTDGSGAVTFETPTTGDITSVVAGSGLTGGATSGAATLNVGAGTGIDVAADAVSVDVSDFMTNGSNNRVVTATGADAMNGEANMTFDGSTLTVTGDVVPGANDSHDLGASDNVWRNLYTGDLHLSNESKSEGNAIDGTKGSWTIQEGAEDLYLFNNKSGKKYKFKLEEVQQLMAFGITAFAESPFAATGSTSVNVAVTGQELTIAETSPGVVIDVVVSLTGQAMTATQGQVSIFAGVEALVTGQSLSSNLGSVTNTGTANISLTGQTITSTLGTATLDANTIASPTGELLSLAEGSVDVTANADISITGQALTMQENAPTVTGDADVNLTGQAMTVALASVTAIADVDVSTTGQELTMQEGQAEADDATAEVTGIAMTMAQGTLGTLIWTEVNTGTAPIDPPGWKEVA